MKRVERFPLNALRFHLCRELTFRLRRELTLISDDGEFERHILRCEHSRVGLHR